MNIFEHFDYKSVLNTQIEHNSHIKGYKTQMAQAAGCGSSFLSHVLSRGVHLTLDQAFGLCSFWNFTDREREYFMTLVNIERAASPQLRTHLENVLEKLRTDERDLSNKLGGGRTDDESAAVYYSSWHYMALHQLLTCPRYQNIPALVDRLGLSETKVAEYLQELKQMGLVTQEGKRWKNSERNIHLPKTSPLIPLVHAQWRHRALERIVQRHDSDVHISGVYSLSKKDAERLKQKMVEFLAEIRKEVMSSPEEDIVCLNVDFFDV